MLLTKDSYKENVERLLKISKTLNVAIAFWGVGADEVLKNVDKGTTRIICNLNLGGTNPHIIKRIRDDGYNIQHLDNFHAKALMGQDAYIIGSANFSANGLGLEGKQTAVLQEVGVLGNDQRVLQEINVWFNQMWNDSKEIRDIDLKKLETIWARRRTGDLDLSGKNYRLCSSDFEGIKAYVCFSESKEDELAEQQAKEVQAKEIRRIEETGEANMDDSFFDSWSYYIDWLDKDASKKGLSPGDLPVDSYLVDVEVNAELTEVIGIVSIYKRVPDFDRIGKKKSIQMIKEVPDFFNIKNNGGKKWQKLLQDLKSCAINYIETVDIDEGDEAVHIVSLSGLLQSIGR